MTFNAGCSLIACAVLGLGSALRPRPNSGLEWFRNAKGLGMCLRGWGLQGAQVLLSMKEMIGTEERACIEIG